MQTYASKSTTIPDEWDFSSSHVYVFHNYNIVEIEETDVQTDKITISYEYDVDKMTKNEYIELLTSNLNMLGVNPTSTAQQQINQLSEMGVQL